MRSSWSVLFRLVVGTLLPRLVQLDGLNLTSVAEQWDLGLALEEVRLLKELPLGLLTLNDSSVNKEEIEMIYF